MWWWPGGRGEPRTRTQAQLAGRSTKEDGVRAAVSAVWGGQGPPASLWDHLAGPTHHPPPRPRGPGRGGLCVSHAPGVLCPPCRPGSAPVMHCASAGSHCGRAEGGAWERRRRVQGPLGAAWAPRVRGEEGQPGGATAQRWLCAHGRGGELTGFTAQCARVPDPHGQDPRETRSWPRGPVSPFSFPSKHRRPGGTEGKLPEAPGSGL